MKYPEEFVEKVLVEYVEWPGYVAMLKEAFDRKNEDGNTDIEALLEFGRSLEKNIDPAKILSALNSGNPESIDFVKEIMNKCVRRREMFREWREFRQDEVKRYLPKEARA